MIFHFGSVELVQMTPNNVKVSILKASGFGHHGEPYFFKSFPRSSALKILPIGFYNDISLCVGKEDS